MPTYPKASPMTGLTTGPMTRRSRALLAGLGAAVLALAVSHVAVAPPAEAASFRYWSYWTGAGGSWSYSSQGASRVPADGTVDGWRFVVSEATGSSTPPRARPDFDALCDGTPPVAGKKRVGVVIDYGTTSDAPPGEPPPAGPVGDCVVLPVAANGYQLLAAVTSLRVEAGMVCGVSGYPAAGCAEPVEGDDPRTPSSTPRPTRTATPTASGTPSGGQSPTATSSSPGEAASSSPTGKASKAPSRSADPTPSAAATTGMTTPLAAPVAGPGGGSGGSPAGLWAAACVLAGLLGAAWVLARRRRT